MIYLYYMFFPKHIQLQNGLNPRHFNTLSAQISSLNKMAKISKLNLACLIQAYLSLLRQEKQCFLKKTGLEAKVGQFTCS